MTANGMLTGQDIAVSNGLAAFGPLPTEIIRRLDAIFTRWAVSRGAGEVTLPPLLPVSELAKIDYYDNFPHLGIVATTIDVEGSTAYNESATSKGAIAAESVNAGRYALPSSTCYGVFFGSTGARLSEDVTVTACSQVFRNEKEYDALRRLMGFRMREVISIGTQDAALKLVEGYLDLTMLLAAEVDLDLDVKTANDPFYDLRSARALMQKVTPLKRELRFDDMAIASVNLHRNFFGERCGIKYDDAYAFSGCVGWGLERWLSALEKRYQGDWDSILGIVGRAADNVL